MQGLERDWVNVHCRKHCKLLKRQHTISVNKRLSFKVFSSRGKHCELLIIPIDYCFRTVYVRKTDGQKTRGTQLDQRSLQLLQWRCYMCSSCLQTLQIAALGTIEAENLNTRETTPHIKQQTQGLPWAFQLFSVQSVHTHSSIPDYALWRREMKVGWPCQR